MLQFDFSIVDWNDDRSPFDSWLEEELSCNHDDHQDDQPSQSGDHQSIVVSSGSLRRRKRQAIHFASHVEVFEIPHINDYSIEDIQATWYSANELQVMRKRVREAASRMEQNCNLAEETEMTGYCCDEDGEMETTLGLETRTVEAIRCRNAKVKAAYDAVLEEQQRQWLSGEQDPDRVAARYQFAILQYSLGWVDIPIQ